MAMPPPPSLHLGGPRRAMRRAAGDKGVQKTNDDAQSTKLSCAALGYFQDDILPLLAKSLPSRKSPIINRGTWARHAAIRQVTTDFITACVQHAQQARQLHATQQLQQQESTPGTSADQQHSSTAGADNSRGSSGNSSTTMEVVCQVVVLGAGSDSSWFTLQQQRWPHLQAVRYIELDYHEMVARKARTILSTDKLLHLLPYGTTATTTPTATAAATQHDSDQGHATWTKQEAAHNSTQQQQQSSESQLADIQSSASPPPAAAAVSSPQTPAAAAAAASHSFGFEPPAAVANHVQELSGPLYSLVGVDLRHIQQFDAALQRAGFDARLPTLYVSECVLIYLEPAEAQALLAAAAARAADAGSSAAVAIYEQTRPDDAFGATMISNLEVRGCPLRSVLSVPTPAAQEQRLRVTGWTAAAAADMAAVYYGSSQANSSSTVAPLGGSCTAAAAGSRSGWLGAHWQAERMRIERIELLDELEEWRLMQEHYCLAIGVTGEGATSWLAEGLQLQQLKALGTAE